MLKYPVRTVSAACLMISMILKAITALGLPVAVLLSGGWILSRVSGLGSVVNQLTQAGHTVPTALNRRWFGYGTREVQVYWHALQESGRRAEKTSLQLDLAFPFLYGGTLAASLLWAQATVNESFQPMWMVAAIAIVMIADWTENLIQLGQLAHYQDASLGGSRLQSAWIRVASCATVIKLWLSCGVYASLVGLVFKIVLTG